MNKFVVISCTDNDDYIFYLPIVTWAWRKLGWGTLVISEAPLTKKFNYIVNSFSSQLFKLSEFPEYSKETIAQCERLYISNWIQGHIYIMVSDCDMLPLSDYWKPDLEGITCYGRDLSDEHYPMCYIGCKSEKWTELMNLTGDGEKDIKRDLDNEKEILWVTDQNIITRRLNERNDITRIDRGINPETGYPVGRCDRSSWSKSLLQKERIDAHLFRAGYLEENWRRIISLIKECFNPTKEEVDFFENYRNGYLKFIQ